MGVAKIAFRDDIRLNTYALRSIDRSFASQNSGRQMPNLNANGNGFDQAGASPQEHLRRLIYDRAGH